MKGLSIYFLNYVLGGKEEKSLEDRQTNEEEPMQSERRSINHEFVTTFRRNRDAIRQEVVESAKNFLQVRFNICIPSWYSYHVS